MSKHPSIAYLELWRRISKKENVKEFRDMAIGNTVLFATSPYYISTTIRVLREAEDGQTKFTRAQDCGGYLGCCMGIAAIVGQSIGYNYLTAHDHPGVLAIPVATNAISGIYELGRKAYMNAKHRSAEKHSSK